MKKHLIFFAALILIGMGCSSQPLEVQNIPNTNDIGVKAMEKFNEAQNQPQDFKLIHNKTTAEFFLQGAKGMDCIWTFTADHGWDAREKTSGNSHVITQISDWPNKVDTKVTCVDLGGGTHSDELLEYSESIGIK